MPRENAAEYAEEVMALLGDGKQRTSRQIADELGWTKQRAYQVVNTLVAQQRVKRNPWDDGRPMRYYWREIEE